MIKNKKIRPLPRRINSLTTRYILIYGVHITVNFRQKLLNFT